MGITCLVVGCSSRSNRDNVRFYRVPHIKESKYYPNLNLLYKKRRELWIEAIKRKDLTPSMLKNQRVCSRHFIGGKPSSLEDDDNPDWVPSLHMGPSDRIIRKGENQLGKHLKIEPPDERGELETTQEETTEGNVVFIKQDVEFEQRFHSENMEPEILSCDEEDNTSTEENTDETILQGFNREEIEVQYDSQAREEIESQSDSQSDSKDREEMEIQHDSQDEKPSASYYEKGDVVEIAYQCKKCPKEFSEKSLLAAHSKLHEPRKVLYCEVCKKQFKQERFFLKHLDSHTKEHPYKCPDCKKTFQTEGNMFVHRQRAHAKDRPFNCCMCPLSFALPGELKAHERSHSENKTFHCDLCDEKFVAKPFFEKHMREHERRRRRFQCGACDMVLSGREDLDEHLRIHAAATWSPEPDEESNLDQHQCTTCGEFFSDARELENHAQEHEEENSMETSSEETEIEPEKKKAVEKMLQQNEDSRSVGVAENNSMDSDCEVIELCFDVSDETHADNENSETLFRCEICGTGFSQKSHLANHMPFHKNRRKLRCPTCYMVFWDKSLLQQHLSNFPAGSCLECPICKKLFPSRNNLSVHKRTAHPTDRPFKCKVCSRTFPIFSSFVRHEATHTDEKPFDCGECGKSFALERYLQRHMTLHERDPEAYLPNVYKCRVCERSFPGKSALKIHMKVHTRVRKYQCEVCNRLYARQYQLNKHFQWHLKSGKGMQTVATTE